MAAPAVDAVDGVSYRVLSGMASSAVLFRHILYDAAGWAVQRVRRDRGRVEQDYHDGVWKRARDSQRWLRFSAVEDYLLPEDDAPRVAKIAHRIVRIGNRDYYRFRNAMLDKVLATHAGDTDGLVELGCGTGLNLLSLARTGRWQGLTGFDISENALAVARESARHFGLDRLAFARFDLTDAEDPGYGQVRGRTAFTHYCLEQLRYAAPAVLRNLIRHGVRRVIHFETSVERLDLLSLRGLANCVYIRRRDYLSHLLRPLEALERQGLVRIVAAWRPGYAPSPKNDPLVVVWEPVAQG